MRILVADDNIDVLEPLAKLLEAHGHTVYRAEDGQIALEAAESFRPDAAILDIGMPRMDGYRVAERIRTKPWGQRMLLVAHNPSSREQDKRRALGAGFDQQCAKPARFDDLRRAVEHSRDRTL